MPEHSRAFSNGCVYEHIVVAEQQILYRALGSEECVHHINHNRSDNRPENLMVFATSNDHSAYHQGRTAQQMSDGSYICKDKYIHKKCPICGGNKDFAAKMCVKCYRKQQLTHKSNKEISENEINT